MDVDMDFALLIAITLQIAAALAKDSASSSDESIENILYYKDCNHQKTEPPIKLRAEERPPPRQPECVPRMCCSMTCANNCGQEQNTVNQQAGPQSPMFMPPMQQSMQPQPQPPQAFNQRARKKKKMMPKPMGGRRNLGFTREHIKSLISQDEDIKKILKDLVRVTMQKADLIDMINARRNGNKNVILDQENPNNNNNNVSNEDEQE